MTESDNNINAVKLSHVSVPTQSLNLNKSRVVKWTLVLDINPTILFTPLFFAVNPAHLSTPSATGEVNQLSRIRRNQNTQFTSNVNNGQSPRRSYPILSAAGKRLKRRIRLPNLSKYGLLVTQIEKMLLCNFVIFLGNHIFSLYVDLINRYSHFVFDSLLY